MKNTITQLLSLGLLSAGLGIGLQAQAQMVVVNVGINQPAALVADAGNTSVGINLCEGDTATLGGSPAASGGLGPYVYTWSPGTNLSSTSIPNPIADPGSSISYTLQVQDANNCTSNSTVAVTVSPTPISAFNFNATGLSVVFADQSVGTVTNWLWDFGDGNTSTLQNPSHVYATPGQYTVCLTASNNGCGEESCILLSVLVGIENAFSIPGLSVFPNPYQGTTNVQFSMTVADNVKLEAFDVQGKLVAVVHDGLLDAGTQTLRFSAAALGAPAGVYLLRLTIGTQQATLRVQEMH
jgi:PKD domain/Secretion system C-terminal sorting domain